MSGYTLAAILVSVACTLSLRALPFLIFTKNRPMPEWLRRLGKTLPMAIMAVLVVYCLKDAFGDRCIPAYRRRLAWRWRRRAISGSIPRF